MKKGQTQLIFVFILAAVIIGLIMLLGYKGIKGITNNAKQAQIEDFVNDLSNDITSLERSRGSSKTKSYSVPTSLLKICFVQSCSVRDGSCTGAGGLNMEGAPTAITSMLEDNLFLLSSSQVVEKSSKLGSLENIEINDEGKDYFCIDNTGRIQIKMEGTGKGVILEQI
ncbi:hypothetical protein KY334_03720 [Candidatus Woesearchaeota archaeon]|nr:hypothetical protein [Candidatus Woesearchaeota archaeon]